MSQAELKNVRPALTVVSWFGVLSLVVVGHDNRFIYLYVVGAIIFTLLTNSITLKVFRNRTLPYDYIVYHFILTLGLTVATFISILRIAPYHRVFRSVTKLFHLVPSRFNTTCQCRTKILEDVPVRIYTPIEVKSDVVVVYYHGGLFSYFNQDTYHAWATTIATVLGCKVILCGHKQAPEYPFPNAVIEAYQVLNWVQSNDVTLEINKKRVVIMGDEAGGCLAASVSLLHKAHQGKSLLDSTSDLQPPIAGQVLVHPILQGFSFGPKATINNCQGVAMEHRALFLSYYISGNYSFSSNLGDYEDNEFPPFWKVCVDDAIKTREPISELKRSLDGIWNQYIFPLMSKDPSNLPPALIIGFTQDHQFDDSRCYSEWLTHHQVPCKLIRDSKGYNGNVLLHRFNTSIADILDHLSEFIDTTIC